LLSVTQVGKFVDGIAAVYLAAAIESVLEEVVAECAACDPGNTSGGTLDASLLEQVSLPLNNLIH